MTTSTRLTSLFLAVLLSILAPIGSASLTYDMATGNQSGFDVNTSEADTNPTNYPGKGEVWTYPGFVGRLNYLGEPTTFTFTNTGPQRTTNPKSMFYFTFQTTPDTSIYREFFLVGRAKGLYHNGNQHDFNNSNFTITTSGAQFVLTKGAGTETAEVGQIGYNTSGGSGTYNGSNAYSFKYPYKLIWLDITLIRTTNKNATTTRGYYESTITVNTASGVNTTLQLFAEYNPRTSQATPWNYYFGVENLLPASFPFSQLLAKNTVANSLIVGNLKYYSTDDTAKVSFASNTAGNQTDFRLTSTTGSDWFAYTLVFDPTLPNTAATAITSATTYFPATQTSVASPVGGSNTGYFMEGEVRIYVNANLFPLSGLYSSYIYCFLTKGN